MGEPVKGRRIVVGVDGSPASRHALRWAVAQGELTGATVEAINILYLPVTDGWAPTFDLIEQMTEAAHRMLAEAAQETEGAHPAVKVEPRVVEGYPATILLAAAEGADLLVLGSRGHGGFVGALLGSVSQHCAQHATCPVVIIRGPM
jgi:nucleotide-binding universal stress UspA family protein